MPKEKMNREELSRLVAKKIAEALPEDFVTACVEEALREYITDFKVEEYEVRNLLKTAVLERTKELLRTKFLAQIDVMAEQVAQKALGGGRI